MKDRLTLSKKKSKLKELVEQSYIGRIVSVDDELKIGRCKIRVYGLYGNDNENLGVIPDEDLPWAYPHYDMCFGSETGSGRFSTPKMNAKVRVILDGDQYHPRYFTMETLDDTLKEAIAADYVNFHALLWDSVEELKMYYAVNTGFLLDLKGSVINILPDNSILINHKDNTATIELKGNDIEMVCDNAITASSTNQATINSNYVHMNGVNTDLGANPVFSNMNGEPMMELLKIMATAVDNKYPVTPGVMIQTVNAMESLILSATVKTTG